MGLAEVSVLQRLLSVLVVSVVVAAPAVAEGPAIEHQPVACVVEGRFPLLAARFAPSESVARARVQFQAEGTRHWYAVAMTRAASGFTGVLPQPKKSLKSYRYYIEVTDTALGTGRTAEYTTTVGANRAACSDVKAAEGLASAVVKLEAAPGAPAVPGGFSTSGVTTVAAAGAAGAAVAAGAGAAAAAGGGISTAVLVVGGVAVAGAGAAVAARAGGGGEGDGSNPTSYEGTFAGEFVVTMIVTGGNTRDTCVLTYGFSGTMQVTLEQRGGALTGPARVNTTSSFRSVTGGGNCDPSGPGGPPGFVCDVTGTAGNLGCSDVSTYEGTSTSGTKTMTVTAGFSGALSGGVISGTLTFAATGHGTGSPGSSPFPVSETDSGSATFPITLR